MKIKKNQLFNTKLTKLKLLETRVYTNKLNTSLKITETAYNLKKALTVIFKYHNYKKKILFVGEDPNSTFNFKKLLMGTNHIIIPKYVWMNGILTNPFMSFKYLKKNKKTISRHAYTSLYRLKKRFDLIVILNSIYKKNIINESYQSNIPVIFLGNCLNNEHAKSSYNIPNSSQLLKEKVRDKFFYLLLVALLKKAKKTKYTESYVFKKKIKGKKFIQKFNKSKRKHRG